LFKKFKLNIGESFSIYENEHKLLFFDWRKLSEFNLNKVVKSDSRPKFSNEIISEIGIFVKEDNLTSSSI